MAGETAVGGSGVAWLLHPFEAEEFIATYWESRPLVVQREAPNYFVNLPSLDTVDELITATASGATRPLDDGRLVRARDDGDRDQRGFVLASNGLPDIQDIYRAYDDGYSVVLNRLQRRSASVAALCRALEADLHHPVAANMYLTPRHGQGFPPHVDTHDVFILQLHGTKEWHVDNIESDLPLARTAHKEVSMPPGKQCFMLRPGDTLYLPRGIPHEAVTSESSSLHLTVGIHVYRWADLLDEALAVLAEEYLPLRQALPRGFLNSPVDYLRLSEIMNDVASAIASNGVAERAKARLGSKLRMEAVAAQPGHFRSIDEIPSLDERSVVARTPGSLCSVRTSGDETSIEFANNYVTGPAIIEPALRFITDHETFMVSDLPGQLSRHERLDLVTRLISEGLLSVPTKATEVYR